MFAQARLTQGQRSETSASAAHKRQTVTARLDARLAAPLGNQAVLRRRANSTAGSGAALRSGRPGSISPQATELIVGEVDDPLEREADQVADRVMAASSSSVSLPPPPDGEPPQRAPVVVRRACAECAEEEDKKVSMVQRKTEGSAAAAAPGIVHQALHSPGQAIDPVTRSFMEARFQADFSGLRVHTGSLADASARAIHARAYTVGGDLVFRNGAYSPATTQGRWLLAHELAHSMQQGAARTGRLGPVLRRDPAPVIRRAPALTDEDGKSCTPLYKQKLCVFDLGGCTTSQSRDAGIPSTDELARYNTECREESGYEGDDVTLNNEECAALTSPVCARGTRAEVAAARARVRNERIAKALQRVDKYIVGGAGAELVRLATDPLFLVTLAAAITAYVLLWLFPEPISKLAAAAVTVALLSTGLFTFSLISNVLGAWNDFQNEAGGAETDEQLEAAAKRFGERIGANGADLIVFLASLLVGGKLPVPKGAPAAAEALQAAESTLNGAAPGAVVAPGAKVIPLRPPSPATPPPVGPMAFEGSAALKISPEFLPEAPPLETPAPAAAEPTPVPKAKPTPATGPKSLPLPPPLPLPSDKQKTSGCKDEPSSESLPISWPTELPFPAVSPRALVRTSAADREWEGIDRGDAQRKVAAEIAANRAANIPPPHPCFQDDAEPNTPFDAHHSHPLYLGGEEAEYNLCALETLRHQRGHRRLDNQTPWLEEYKSQGVCSPFLSQHPSGQKYDIVGEK